MMDANLGALLQRQAERLGPRVALRYPRDGLYHDVTWQDYAQRAAAGAALLAQAGIRPGDRVGLWSENRLEWLLADMAILTAGAVNVPAHSTLSPRQVEMQFRHAEVSWLFLASEEHWRHLRPLLSDLPLRGVVLFDGRAQDAWSWPAFLARGLAAWPGQKAEIGRRLAAVGRDDLATIMYTSGTTGNPKGVMLTHGNLLSNAESMLQGSGVSSDSVILGWLPLSHIYARLVDHYLHLEAGCVLCLAETAETVLKNAAEVHPTSISGVPRFFEKVLAAVGPQRLRHVFGRRLQWLNSGGAPLPPAIARAYADAGVLLLQGYGLTETSPVISFNRREANRIGTVGQAVPGVEIRIAADGEVLTRGPHVMKGYWKDPQATAEVLRDGWLHTGDLGYLDQDGYLTITGRKKDLIVLSNGKKVVPTEVENRLMAEPCIEQVVVFGEGKSYLTALIVPNLARLRAALEKEGVFEAQDERLVRHPRAIAYVQERVQAALADAASWEKVQRFVLLPRPFSQDAGEMTVSLKLRRGVIAERYRQQLQELYAAKDFAAEAPPD
jgi:long-chain acyl-CoA synthetase